jgi:phosphate transport system substrate-binding protein
LRESQASRSRPPRRTTPKTGPTPLTRYLSIALNKPPNRALPPLESEFLKLVLSKQGQEAVVRDGYIPLPAAVLEEERKKAGL